MQSQQGLFAVRVHDGDGMVQSGGDGIRTQQTDTDIGAGHTKPQHELEIQREKREFLDPKMSFKSFQ